ncbi:MAG TPA: dTDP-4-dehydrorhamnose reductase [Paludibacteraceae bacterium]|nr:dTDP-4-dehydrorhamnose reductase [Paludibacteraceae bacterium]HOU67006.1 dTDP-4-dehydrorhamnose reductase [Paludibacteraceae bacterium]HPH62081.1 dTDP-4-dehydrorhamnose reductase [Paludibacteraceae bacterium]HQF49209.1 dTDP-4-dehydrorhamnose reductase [Paludibacteraceae bacterium]HQJ89405.1 dTDP-4-dehydrorhamnose reductase [Paludibacteraceae bacterium]
MNILVTGANGQLGNSIQKISKEYPSNNFFFTDMPEVDITNLELLENLMRENKINAIVNCAAYTAVDKAEDNEAIAAKINVDGPRNLAIAAKNANAKLVHVSTDYVFNGKNNLPLKETDTTDPIGAYGRTKRAGEVAVEEVGGDAIVIRTAWLYSEFGGNFVKTMLRLGKEKTEMGVVYDQIGTPTYATDLAYAIMDLLTKGFSGFTLYHFSNEGVISWYDFAKTIFDLSGINIKLNALESSEYPSKAERPAYSVLNKKKIKLAGVNVPYWRDSLIQCLELLK